MKLTIHLEGKTKEELAKQLAEHLALLTAAPAAKAGKAAPAAKKGKAKDEDEEDDSDDEDEEESEDDEDEDEEEEESDGPTLEDVLAACQKYAKKHGRAAVPGVLKKFKVESARDLKPAQFEKVLAALKAKKA